MNVIRLVYLPRLQRSSATVTLATMARRPTAAERQRMLDSVQLHVLMEQATTEAEFQELLAQHDACTDANVVSRLRPQPWAAYKQLEWSGQSMDWKTAFRRGDAGAGVD
jgi:hypothetical protein